MRVVLMAETSGKYVQCVYSIAGRYAGVSFLLLIWRLRLLLLVCMVTVVSMVTVPAGAAELLTPCRIPGFPREVQCGQLQRPLNPAQEHGTQIQLYFIVLPAQDKNKSDDPLFLLAGGPGQSAIHVAAWANGIFEKLRRRRDLVFVDQRGTGRSAPLQCPESSNSLDDLDHDSKLAYILRCKTRLEKLPYGDLRFFTTSVAVQDLEAVRRALAYPKINMAGVSYGTRVALEYARQFPASVRRIVLDGVVPPDQSLTGDGFQQALLSLFADCAADESCKKAYPGLPGQWDKLLADLPEKTMLAHPRLLSSVSTVMTRDALLGMVATVLYSPVSSAGLPYAIQQAGLGHFAPLLGLSGAGDLTDAGNIFYGMHFSVWCSEEYARLPVVSPYSNFGSVRTKIYAEVCPRWPRGAVPPAFYTIPVSPVPVLLLSGEIDPATPFWYAEHVAKELGSGARHLILAHSGHGILGQRCMAAIVTRFFNADTDQLAHDVDATCIRPVPRPRFWLAPRLAESKP